MQEVKITALSIYPVKSLQGISLNKAIVTPLGLMWDRFWMIVDTNGLFVSQRTFANMATIKTAITHDCLVLSHESCEDLKIPLQPADLRPVEVQVWKSECQALDEGQQASEWLTNILGEYRGGVLRLVRMAPDFKRAVSQKHTSQSANTYFADGYPYLVANQASLKELNNRLAEKHLKPVSMDRFRANIEIAASEPWLEHKMELLVFPDGQKLDLCKPCERCKVITMDQESGKILQKSEPLNTLFNMNNIEAKGAYFGQNAVLMEHNVATSSFEITVGSNVKLV